MLVEKSCCCLVSFVRPRELVSIVCPRELVSFVRPRELVSFVCLRELVSFVRLRELVSFVRLRDLVSFVRPRELVSFDPRHVTRFPPIGNVFELGGITITCDCRLNTVFYYRHFADLTELRDFTRLIKIHVMLKISMKSNETVYNHGNLQFDNL